MSPDEYEAFCAIHNQLSPFWGPDVGGREYDGPGNGLNRPGGRASFEEEHPQEAVLLRERLRAGYRLCDCEHGYDPSKHKSVYLVGEWIREGEQIQCKGPSPLAWSRILYHVNTTETVDYGEGQTFEREIHVLVLSNCPKQDELLLPSPEPTKTL